MKTKKQQTFKQVVTLSERNWKNLRSIARTCARLTRTPINQVQERIILTAIQFAVDDYDVATPKERKQLGDEAHALLANAKQDKWTITVGPHIFGRLLDLSNQGGENALIAFVESAVARFLVLMADERSGFAGSRPCRSTQ